MTRIFRVMFKISHTEAERRAVLSSSLHCVECVLDRANTVTDVGRERVCVCVSRYQELQIIVSVLLWRLSVTNSH